MIRIVQPAPWIFLVLLSIAATNAPQSRVVVARDASAVHGLKVDAAKVRNLVAAGIQAFAGQSNTAAAWRSMFSSNDVVGIKISTLAAPLHATHHEVVDAIVAGLESAGVASTNIIVWDRDPRRLRLAGYLNAHAVINETGWDSEQFYESNLVGKLIWGDLQFGQEEPLGTRSHFPKLLTEKITKLINVPILMDHDACGLAGSLYNISIGALDNTRRFEQFGQTGNPFIAEIATSPVVRPKLVLHIADALIGGYAGGPGFKPQYSWPLGAIYFSRDPVALDTICLELIEEQRKQAHITPIDTNAGHITSAGRLGLGQSDRAQIEIIEAPNP